MFSLQNLMVNAIMQQCLHGTYSMQSVLSSALVFPITCDWGTIIINCIGQWWKPGHSEFT